MSVRENAKELGIDLGLGATVLGGSVAGGSAVAFTFIEASYNLARVMEAKPIDPSQLLVDLGVPMLIAFIGLTGAVISGDKLHRRLNDFF